MKLKINKTYRLSPPQILVSGFALIILVGAVLLSLPIASSNGTRLAFIDALFTATSATCVTGLVVVDTGTYFSTFGQIVIASLVQIGGLGFMTMATLFAFVLKKKISLRERLILQQAMNQISMEGIVRLIRKVVLYSLVIESVAALILFMRFSMDMPVRRALYFGIFHSISLFNNAGFDLFGEFRSLTGYVDDITVNVVAMGLIILGGLGFIVIAELLEYKKAKRKLSLHSKVVLTATGFLIFFGTIVIFLFEYTNSRTLGSLDMSGKILASFFQSVMPRSAGVSTISLAEMRQASQFFMIILMFIGASPGSTGGGIKTTTFTVLIGAVLAMIRGKEDIVLFRLRLAKNQISKSVTFTLLALFMVIFVSMVLSTTEDHQFLMILYETTSAFGTVGASTGLTQDLTRFGKVMIMLTMFAGRLAPLTFAYTLGNKKDKELYRHPEGKIIIG